jgi:membrane protein
VYSHKPPPGIDYHVSMPIFDRLRARAFAHFLWQRFLEDRCLQAAGALAYTSLFALVPLFATVLAILTAFPVYSEWRQGVTEFVFRNFLPAAGDVVQNYFTGFAENASKATAIGILVLLFSSVSLMLSIEDTFNRIWRVTTARPAVARVILYWTVLTLGPLLLVATIALSSYVFALPLLEASEAESLKTHALHIAPFVLQFLLLLVAYALIPHRRVYVRHALVGALLATILIELAKRGFAAYIAHSSYEQVYGTLAIVPIFIFWIYLSWTLVLLGASVTSSLAAFDYRPPGAPRLREGEEFVGLLRVLARFAQAQREGYTLHSAQLCALEPFLTDDLVQRYLGDLERAGMIQRNESGGWLLSRDLATLTLYDLYAASGYRIPPGRAAPDDDEAGARAMQALAAAQQALRGTLAVALAEIFPPPPRSGNMEPETPQRRQGA